MIWVSAAFAGVEHGRQAPPGLDEAHASRRVALVVGIDAYDDPALGDLRYAAKDAADMASVLQDPTIGGYDVVSTVLGKVPRETFWSALKSVSAGLERDDTVVVYVASHGTLDLGPDGTELFLLSSDAWLASAADTGIRVSELSDAIEALPAKRKVLVLDACYAGTGRSVLDEGVRKKLEGLRGPVPAPPALQVSAFSAHLYAAAVHQPAIEDPALQNGVYTHYLIEGLKGAADIDGDGLVEVMEAHQWARDRTLEHTGGTQVPWAEVVTVGRDAVYLTGNVATRKGAEHALLVGLENLPSGAEVTVDGIARGAGPLQEGEREIEVHDGGRLLLRDRVSADPGDRVRLDARVVDRASHVELSAGAVGSLDRSWLGGLGAGVGVRALPRDPSGLRGWYGGSASLSSGPVRAPGGPFPVGLVGGLAGFGPSGQGWRLGPEVGLGLAWRGATALETAPMASLGVSGVLSVGPWLLGADLCVPAFPADGRLVASSRASLSTGYRF